MTEVYLDNSATTRCLESVANIVAKVMCEDYGNPSSMHMKGVQAENYVKMARMVNAKNLKANEKLFSLPKRLCPDGRQRCL